MMHTDLAGKIRNRELGWNGFRVFVPESWDAARLGNRYILLENAEGPVMEAKWTLSNGKSDPEKVLKKLGKSILRQNGGQSLNPFDLPDDWSTSMKGFRHVGFQWQGDIYSGKGVVACCSKCRRTTLLQFYSPRQKCLPERATVDHPSVLSSFTDHSVDGYCLWSVFDIRLLLPDTLSLVRHSFSPGAFQIDFACDSLKLSFFRWGPASAILAENRLDEFVKKQFRFDIDGVKLESESSGEWYEFRSIPPLSILRGWFSKMRKKPVYQWGRVWRQNPSNRILAVVAKSHKNFDSNFPKKLCSFYETV
jgi:hypothetical protein